MIKTPFTPEQVEAFNRYQQRGDMHPFTCPGISVIPECHPMDRNLIATEKGWFCVCGMYHQDWAHDSMAEAK